MALIDNVNTGTQADEIPDYYCSVLGPENAHSFKDLDTPTNLDAILPLLQSNNTRNFVLDCSDSASYVCIDANTPLVASLLDAERPDMLGTRWINIWHPAKQTSLLQLLAKHYDFSPRLLALMCSDPGSSGIPRNQARHKKMSPEGRRRFPVTEQTLEDGLEDSSEGSSMIIHDSVPHAHQMAQLHIPPWRQL